MSDALRSQVFARVCRAGLLSLGALGALLVPAAPSARSANASSNNDVIVPAVSIGPVSLGEHQANVVAIAGP